MIPQSAPLPQKDVPFGRNRGGDQLLRKKIVAPQFFFASFFFLKHMHFFLTCNPPHRGAGVGGVRAVRPVVDRGGGPPHPHPGRLAVHREPVRLGEPSPTPPPQGGGDYPPSSGSIGRLKTPSGGGVPPPLPPPPPLIRMGVVGPPPPALKSKKSKNPSMTLAFVFRRCFPQKFHFPFGCICALEMKIFSQLISFVF